MSLLTTTRANAAGRVQGFVERGRRRYVARGCESGDTGELVLCPNRRPYRRFVITNIIEKLVSQNDLYRRKFVRKLDAEVRVIPL